MDGGGGTGFWDVLFFVVGFLGGWGFSFLLSCVFRFLFCMFVWYLGVFFLLSSSSSLLLLLLLLVLLVLLLLLLVLYLNNIKF